MSSILFKSKDDNYNIEYTVHNCPKSMKRDIYPVFKNELNIDDDILIIPTWQEARLSITNISDDVSKELDRLFLNFRDWALILKKYVNDLLYLKDFPIYQRPYVRSRNIQFYSFVLKSE